MYRANCMRVLLAQATRPTVKRGSRLSTQTHYGRPHRERCGPPERWHQTGLPADADPGCQVHEQRIGARPVSSSLIRWRTNHSCSSCDAAQLQGGGFDNICESRHPARDIPAEYSPGAEVRETNERERERERACVRACACKYWNDLRYFNVFQYTIGAGVGSSGWSSSSTCLLSRPQIM